MPSRAERFADAMAEVGSARSTCEELRDELQSWLDNMPENLQSSSKADQLQEAIDALDEVIGRLDDAEGTSVEFPGMLG